MYRRRLRPAYSLEELEGLYPDPYHTSLPAQHMRINSTIAVGKWLMTECHISSVADLSCGANEIVRSLNRFSPCETWSGDLAPGYNIQGPIEETLDSIPHVNLFILSETLEHLDQPEEVLRRLRDKTDVLLLSTPIDEGRYVESFNKEHYWGWDSETIGNMLRTSGFKKTLMRTDILTEVPRYLLPTQIWGVK